ncbi:hypothetical protein J4E85_008147 [Alternaria conjuncta]|uniref:uncharacterized protein n=1 Tax=Alternaria conjuncta TaxID=181017 RepID=UPI0022208761|nr:uncharacterized protein J4E85_008147 [Alternaria conjuncta]KAI4923988.1 hypothetical protein J4E85_008147 [Alternaria conjuncta]
MISEGSEDTQTGAPQEVINEFWDNLITKRPEKVTKIFPPSLYAHLLPTQRKEGIVTGKNAAESYEAAATQCRARVARVVKECHRTNEKFTDADFDIEDLSDKNCQWGLMSWFKEEPAKSTNPQVSPMRLGNALSTLVQSGVVMSDGAVFDFTATAKLLTNRPKSSKDGPNSVHRVDWIFENPQFELDGFSSSDLRQGSNGDCWFIAAVATICSNPVLMNKICVARDEECGVYGFVFYRDGEWIWTVIDDNLYLECSDFDTAFGDQYDPANTKEKKYKKNNQTGSEALYFASCVDENETWLPLLEKAYAKVHGDYDAIAGGCSGEAVEDLTGGVTTKILTDRVLSKKRLWAELLQAGKEFLFSASSPGMDGDDSDARRGLALSHAYSILKAVDAEGEDGTKYQLVLIRNPWGKRVHAGMGEWTGPWSDGSREWTAYWMDKLGHKFGDDGLFWMSYEDLLKRFDLLDRTRLFNEEWTVVQRWTSVPVAWVTGYVNTKFSVEIKKSGPTVFVLCQLDERYFKGLEGKYDFDLHFILQEQGSAAGDYIIRARGAWFGNRSISAEVDLEAGVYEVLPKIEASRNKEAPDVPEVVTKLAERNPQKLRQIGLNYDIANAKGIFELSEEEQKKKEQRKKEAKEKKMKKKEAKEKEKAEFEAWRKEKAEFETWQKEKKAEYEAWKKEKNDHEIKETPEKAGKSETVPLDNGSQPEQTTATDAPEDASHGTEQLTSSDTDDKPNAPANLTIQLKDSSDKTEPATEPALEPHDPSNNSGGDHTPTSETFPNEPYFSPSQSPRPYSPNQQFPPPQRFHSQPPPDFRRYPHPRGNHVYGGAPPPQDVPQAQQPKPWNAVCVLGLRVYSQDPEVSIKLVKPRDDEECAILDVDGETAAGATM